LHTFISPMLAICPTHLVLIDFIQQQKQQQ
jgi:hypothetical protein